MGGLTMREALLRRSQGLHHLQFAAAALLCMGLCMPTLAQETVSRGSVSLSYQNIREGNVATTIGDIQTVPLPFKNLTRAAAYPSAVSS